MELYGALLALVVNHAISNHPEVSTDTICLLYTVLHCNKETLVRSVLEGHIICEYSAEIHYLCLYATKEMAIKTRKQ